MGFVTKSNTANREIETPEAKILSLGSIAEIIDFIATQAAIDATKAEAIIIKKFRDSATVDLRASIRSKLEAVKKDEATDTEVPKFTDAEILSAENWENWTPSIREASDPISKLGKLLSGVDIDQLAKMLAQQRGITEEEAKATLANIKGE